MSLVEAQKLTVREAAKKAGLAESTMRAEIFKGRVPVIRIGTKMLITEADLESYLRGHYGVIQFQSEPPKFSARLPKEISESELINPKRRSA